MVYTALPTDIPEDPPELYCGIALGEMEANHELAMSITHEIIEESTWLRTIEGFLAHHTGADFGGIRPPVEKTEYRHKHRNIKKHGGKPPVDYTYVEEFIDLTIFIEERNFAKAVPLYYKLKSIIGY